MSQRIENAPYLDGKNWTNFKFNESSAFDRLAGTLIICSALGLILTTTLVQLQYSLWVNALVFALPMCIVFGFIVPSAFYVCRSLPYEKRQFYRVFFVYSTTSFITGMAWLFICLLWNSFLAWSSESSIAISRQMAISLWFLGSASYLLVLLANDALLAFRQVHIAKQCEQELVLLAREAELQMLRTQINPHFLFNSLNSISALTAISPDVARKMAISLAGSFRYSLALSDKKFVSLADEVQLCRYFLEIEKIRFGEKLQVEFVVEENVQAALLPPMLLQPLFENAIKHGIRNLLDGGTITCHIRANEGWLHIAMSNPVDTELKANTESGSGTGLKNIYSRLVRHYGKKYRFDLSKKDHTFDILITLPLRFSNTRHC